MNETRNVKSRSLIPARKLNVRERLDVGLWWEGEACLQDVNKGRIQWLIEQINQSVRVGTTNKLYNQSRMSARNQPGLTITENFGCWSRGFSWVDLCCNCNAVTSELCRKLSQGAHGWAQWQPNNLLKSVSGEFPEWWFRQKPFWCYKSLYTNKQVVSRVNRRGPWQRVTDLKLEVKN